jgi:hypothetical protein
MLTMAMRTIRHNSRWAAVAVTAIKSVHTAIFLGMGSCVVYILYSGLTGHISRLTQLSMGVVACEGLIFFGNGRRCPLTDLAEDLGSEHGTVGDIFLPVWLARRIPIISSTLIAVGLAGMATHQLFDARRHVDGWPGRA